MIGARLRQVGIRIAACRGNDRPLVLRLTGRGIFDRAAATQHLGQAPIHHLDFAKGADHHVGRFQVAVDHASGVGVGHRLTDGFEDRQQTRQAVAG